MNLTRANPPHTPQENPSIAHGLNGVNEITLAGNGTRLVPLLQLTHPDHMSRKRAGHDSGIRFTNQIPTVALLGMQAQLVRAGCHHNLLRS